MPQVNLVVGWSATLLGLVAGAVIGTFFHNDEWLGGYGSWRRRMLRLAHVALVGTGLLNIAFALSLASLPGAPRLPLASVLFIVGAVAMPTVCALSAWRIGFRNLFFVPVVSLIAATADLLFWGLLR